jgi:hypothetical protein
MRRLSILAACLEMPGSVALTAIKGQHESVYLHPRVVGEVLRVELIVVDPEVDTTLWAFLELFSRIYGVIYGSMRTCQ